MVSINLSQYLERICMFGIMCDERSKDPQKNGRGRFHTTHNSDLNSPDETQWAYSLSEKHSQILALNGEKFDRKGGEHGIGETPNCFLKGTKCVLWKPLSENQSPIVLGALPTDGGDNQET